MHAHTASDVRAPYGSVRLGFILYYDDLEVVNPLGAFHGRHKLGMSAQARHTHTHTRTHKQTHTRKHAHAHTHTRTRTPHPTPAPCTRTLHPAHPAPAPRVPAPDIHRTGMFYWALVNTPLETRMAFHNLHLMTVALCSDIDYYGIEQVVSGLPGDDSFGSAMTALDSGIHLRASSHEVAFLRGWCVCLSADFPAAGLCVGFKKSVSAHLFCRECYVNRKHAPYPAPSSFLDENAHLQCNACMRDQETYLQELIHFQTLRTQREKDKYLTSLGMNSFAGHAFTRVPHFDLTTMIPYDFMHVELEGSLKNELAAMLYHFIRHRPGWQFSLTALNARIQTYAWPGGYKPPTFTEGYLNKGTTAGLPKKGCHVHMTSGDMMTFARHSIDLMLPLVQDTTDPVWLCWVAHVRYVRLLLQQSLTSDEVVELDWLIYDHHTQFLACHGKRMFKPKNHFACHFPTDIRNHGPVRTYWCMRFEALNQLFKTFAKTGAFRNTVGRCADFWTMRMAMEREFGTRSNWGATKVVYGSNPHVYSRRDAEHAGDATARFNVIGQIFKWCLPESAAELRGVVWVSTLYHRGVHYTAGQSWFSFVTPEGHAMVAFIPAGHGIVMVGNDYYCVLHCYPNCHRSKDAYGRISITFASDFKPNRKLMRIQRLQNMVPLWPSRIETSADGTCHYRFVSLE
jgi:hypothetical protein